MRDGNSNDIVGPVFMYMYTSKIVLMNLIHVQGQ